MPVDCLGACVVHPPAIAIANAAARIPDMLRIVYVIHRENHQIGLPDRSVFPLSDGHWRLLEKYCYDSPMIGGYFTLVLVLLAIGIVTSVVVVAGIAIAILMPPRMTDGIAVWVLKRLSPGDLGLAFEDVAFAVRDEQTGKPMRIAGWWIPVRKTTVNALFLHGYADAKVGAIGWAPLWHALGFNILALDLRPWRKRRCPQYRRILGTTRRWSGDRPASPAASRRREKDCPGWNQPRRRRRCRGCVNARGYRRWLLSIHRWIFATPRWPSWIERRAPDIYFSSMR